MNDYFVNLFVTDVCNFRCRYCYEKDGCQTKSNMSEKTADEVIRFIANSISADQKLIVTFHGGEPLLQFDLIKYIIKQIRSELNNKAVFGITTNGSMLTDEMADYLANNMQYKLSISIDGNEETQSFNRPAVNSNFDYEKVMKYAEYMNKINPIFTIRMTYDRHNISDLFSNIRYFIDRGFDRIIIEADFMSDEWEMEDFDRIYEQFIAMKGYIYGMENRDITVYPINSRDICLNNCTAGHDYYSISTTGQIFPCTMVMNDEKHCLGNVRKGIDKAALDFIDNITSKHTNECSDCTHSKFCTTNRCFFINYASTGDYYSPNLVMCNLRNIKHRLDTDKTVFVVTKETDESGSAYSEDRR